MGAEYLTPHWLSNPEPSIPQWVTTPGTLSRPIIAVNISVNWSLYLHKHQCQIDECGNVCTLTRVLNLATTFKWVFSIKLRPIYLYGNYPTLVAPRAVKRKEKISYTCSGSYCNDSAVFPEPTHYADWAVTLKIHMTSNVLCKDSVNCQGLCSSRKWMIWWLCFDV